MKKNKKQKKCIDCGKLIYKASTRCQSCATIKQMQDPKQREKISKAMNGHIISKETRKKISKATSTEKLSKKFLYQEYIVNNKGGLQIAKETKICKTLIWKWLRGYKISKQKELRKRITKKLLVNAYIKNEMSMESIAKELNQASSTIYDLLKEYNIKTRDKGEAQIGREYTKETRKLLSLAQGGTGTPYENTEYGAEFDNALKEQIRFRDNYTCQECGCSQLENGRQLDCHHIDYDKQNNKPINLISLCRKCHMETNYNREQWEEYFVAKMKSKKCDISL